MGATPPAAMAAKVIQAIRPHIQMIKFPVRSSLGSKEVPLVPPHPIAAASPPQTVTQPPPAQKPRADDTPVGKTPRGSGIDFRDLPAKYRRKPLDQEEIDYICRGGPE